MGKIKGWRKITDNKKKKVWINDEHEHLSPTYVSVSKVQSIGHPNTFYIFLVSNSQGNFIFNNLYKHKKEVMERAIKFMKEHPNG